MQLVVVRAVRNAVRAATSTFTASSIIFVLFMILVVWGFNKNLRKPISVVDGFHPFVFTPCIIESKYTCLRCFTN